MMAWMVVVRQLLLVVRKLLFGWNLIIGDEIFKNVIDNIAYANCLNSKSTISYCFIFIELASGECLINIINIRWITILYCITITRMIIAFRRLLILSVLIWFFWNVISINTFNKFCCSGPLNKNPVPPS